MKNKWDALKKDLSNWKTLKLRATDLGFNPVTGTIAADLEWWEVQAKSMDDIKKFLKAPLANEDLLERLFEETIFTNVNSYVPEAEPNHGHKNDEGRDMPTGAGHSGPLATDKGK